MMYRTFGSIVTSTLSWTISCAAAVLLVVCAAGGPAAADDIATCRNAGGDDAIAACTRLLKRRDLNRDVIYRLRGDEYLEKGDYDRAIADYNEALKLNPNFQAVIANRGVAFRKKGDYDRAIADYDAALKLDPNDADVRTNRNIAISLKWQPDIDACTKAAGDAAIAACTRLLSVDGVNRDNVYKNRADASLRKGDYDRAIADYDEALKHNPNNADAPGNRGAAYLSKGDLDRAIADLDQAIRLAPQAAGHYSNRAIAYARKGNYDRAIADYSEAIRLNPKQAGSYNSRSWSFYLMGDYDRAIADADEALRLAPGDANSLDSRGAAWSGKGDQDRAIADLDRAIRLDSMHVAAHSHLGLAWSRKGDFSRAMAEANRALANDPKNVDAYSARALIYAGHGDRDLAAADYQTALKLAPYLAGTADMRKIQAALAAPLAVRPQETAAVTPPQVRPGPQPAVQSEPQGQRVALVIGNTAYRAVPALANPKRDAEAVAGALRQAGFQTVDLVLDLERDAMVKALRAFRDKADHADWALVYYAGHGIEIDRMNYLVPVDARLADERDVKEEAVSYDTLMNAIGGARALRLVVLDACRNNPFKERMHRAAGSRSAAGRGLAAPPESEPGTLVVYSAKEGATAEDDVDGANSPFARAFVAELQVPGLEVRRVFDNIRDDVIEATRNRQQPFSYGSLPGRRDFYFNPAK
jgi:tetratricopeptide (TPR) repeat protein